MKELTFGSLFAGIGGIDLGLERAGMTCKWQVENDPFCREVLKRHWPHVPLHGDIREVSGLEHVDVIAGGFPCQDLSQAGSRKGIEGERSGLWFEMSRIIREVRPRYVIVENVAGLLTRGIDRVLGEMAECGYDAIWFPLSAAAVGAPHLRKRIFIVGSLRGASGPVPDAIADTIREFGERYGEQCGKSWPTVAGDDGSEGDVADPDEGGCEVERVAEPAGCGAGRGRERTASPDPKCDGLEGEQPAGPAPRTTDRPVNGGDQGWWRVEPDVGRVVDGLSDVLDGSGNVSTIPATKGKAAGRTHRLRALGNAVVPQVAEYVGRVIVAVDERARA